MRWRRALRARKHDVTTPAGSHVLKADLVGPVCSACNAKTRRENAEFLHDDGCRVHQAGKIPGRQACLPSTVDPSPLSDVLVLHLATEALFLHVNRHD